MRAGRNGAEPCRVIPSLKNTIFQERNKERNVKRSLLAAAIAGLMLGTSAFAQSPNDQQRTNSPTAQSQSPKAAPSPAPQNTQSGRSDAQQPPTNATADRPQARSNQPAAPSQARSNDNAANPPAQRFVDMTDIMYDGLVHYDEGIYTSLARMLNEEPVQPEDLQMMGMLIAGSATVADAATIAGAIDPATKFEFTALADTNQYGATGQQPVDEHPAIDRSGQCDQQPDEQRVCKAVGQYGGSTVLWPDQYRAVAHQYQRLGQPHGKPAHARQPIYQPAECQAGDQCQLLIVRGYGRAPRCALPAAAGRSCRGDAPVPRLQLHRRPRGHRDRRALDLHHSPTRCIGNRRGCVSIATSSVMTGPILSSPANAASSRKSTTTDM